MIARAISAKRNQALPSMKKFMRQVSIAAFYFGVSGRTSPDQSQFNPIHCCDVAAGINTFALKAR